MNLTPSSISGARDRIARPILIVSTPRSGSTLLFETLTQAPGLFSTRRESHMRIEQVADFHPARRGWTSNRLDSSDAAPVAVEQLAENFYRGLQDRDGRAASGVVRMVEKTPKNALRVPFFAAAWPDSLFVFLHRDVRQTLGSMIEAWRSGRFATYPRLPGWGQPPWSLLLVPGWRALIDRPLAEIVARQWASTIDTLVDDLSELPPGRVVGIDYEQFTNGPQDAMIGLAKALGLDWDVRLEKALPLSQHTQSAPSTEKWRQYEAEIEQVSRFFDASEARAQAFMDKVRV
jgi:hypothetical protein